VLETKWPVQRGAKWRFPPFPSREFPHHDDVGILAQNMAQSHGKGQANIAAHAI